MILIRNAHILPMVGDDLPCGDILINNGRIEAIGVGLSAGEDAQIIDAAGKYHEPRGVDRPAVGDVGHHAAIRDTDVFDDAVNAVRRIVNSTTSNSKHNGAWFMPALWVMFPNERRASRVSARQPDVYGGLPLHRWGTANARAAARSTALRPCDNSSPAR